MQTHKYEDLQCFEELILGHLDPALAERLRLHAATCAACADRLVEAEDYVQVMRQAIRELDSNDQPMCFITRLTG